MSSNLQTTLAAALIALLIGIGIGYVAFGMSKPKPMTMAGMMMPTNEKEADLKIGMRKLWADHVFWTREYITTFAAGETAAANAAAARLMKNQEDIGAAVAQYYGADAGNQLTKLLKEHIAIAVDVLKAAKAGDNTALTVASTKWQQNADDIAVFLSKANPAWPEAALKQMMQMHLQTTTDEAVASLKGDYAGSVAAFDKVFDHINMMADALSAGIITQFPDKFN